MGGKTTTSTNTVTIPKEVMDRYNAINTKAESISNTPFQKYGDQASDFVAQMNEQQKMGISGLNKIAESGPSYNTVQNYLNPYLTNVADTTRKQMEQANEQAQSGALGTAAQSGAFGGDRAGVAAANLANQQNMAMGSTMANIYSQGYDQATNANMNDLNRMAGLAGNQLAMGTQMQQTEQAGKDALINQFQQEQGYPFQVLSWLANIGLGTGAQSGSTTTATQPASFWSDRRLKHDIKEIGTSHDGMPIYTFKYKGDPQEQTHVGFMADEVEKKHPEAVGLDPSGYKTVNYDKATESMGGGVHPHHRGEAFASGGVAGPYGSPVGSQPGSAGYVPEGYLPVGDVMVADPNFLSQQQQGLADMLSAAAGAGKDLSQLNEYFGKNGKFYKQFDSQKAYGGGVDGGLIPAPIVAQGVAPQQHRGYLDDVLAKQEADKKQATSPQSAGGSGQQQSGLSNVANTLGSAATIATALPKIASLFGFSDRRLKHDIKEIGKTHNGLPIYTFKYKGDDAQQTHVGFMADEVERKHPDAVGQSQGYKTVDYSQAHKFSSGGVAGGRHGYALDGAVMDPEQERRRLLASETVQPQTLGSLPDAKLEMATTAPAATVVPPLAPATSIRPMVRPQGLAAAEVPANQTPAATGVSPLAPTTSIRPVVRPEGLGVATVEPASGDDAAREFFNTKMLNQESGNRQFDPKTGETIMSPKGAAGIAQVTKPTGPEAAALAGKEWDENRWLNDTEYNKALGEAYFLHQYHKFGSLDKAAAAYNAGPGRLRRAMENAAIHGGSYMDYLPDETKNYIKATTGLGGDVVGGLDGGSRLSVSTMDGDQQPAGGVKPYEDRNWLGKIMRNPEDGSMNKDAMLSLFAGIGDMLSNPSPFLLPTIGAGVSGAANTYMAREGQVANIQNTRMDMMKKASDEAIKYNLKYGTNFTPEEYIRNALDINRPPSESMGTGTGGPAAGSFNGIPLDVYGRNMSDKITLPNGQQIEAGNSLEYLTALKNAISEYVAVGGVLDPDYLQSINDRIINVTANKGFVSGYEADGVTPTTVQDPAVMAQAAGAVGGGATLESNVNYANEGKQFFDNYAASDSTIDRMAENLSKFDAGSLSATRANLTSLLASMFPEKGDAWAAETLGRAGDDAAAYQLFQKEAAAFLRNELGQTAGSDTAPASVINMLGPLTPEATMNPRAIYGLLLYSKAALKRKEKYYAARDPNDSSNFYGFVQDFNKNNPMDASVKEAMREMLPPSFAEVVRNLDPNTTNQKIEEAWLNMPVEEQGLYFAPPDGVNN